MRIHGRLQTGAILALAVLSLRFAETVRERINTGHPILWSVTLGFIEEDPPLPQAQGGHLRLITGFNATTREILYSDSWGAKHEKKRMKLSDAYAITTGMFTIEPN